MYACGSGAAALDEARVQADVSDVMSVQQPGEEALQAQSVAAVRTRAILPLKHNHKPVNAHGQGLVHVPLSMVLVTRAATQSPVPYFCFIIRKDYCTSSITLT